MTEQPSLGVLRESLLSLMADAVHYFEAAQACTGPERHHFAPRSSNRSEFWNLLDEPLQERGKAMVARLMLVASQLTPLLRISPLVTEADQRELSTTIKAMRAAILLRSFQHWDVEVIHDEDIVLGVRPPGQSEDAPLSPQEAGRIFMRSSEQLGEITQLIEASGELNRPPLIEFSELDATRYRPGTAFIMMSMDKSDPQLDDVCDAIKAVFASFDVNAVRADDIEHEDQITTRILNEISTAEFLFADLTGAKPNVYYEVGYAHALHRRVILLRKKDTGIHFDLAGYNCPEYESLRELKEKLAKRLEHVTNRRPKTVAPR